jgi:predicted O-linked N-acetylglucosamine transferase (SPINDLY family)
MNLAFTQSKLKFLSAAIQMYLSALRIKENSFEALVGVADSYGASDNYDLAVDYYQKAFRLKCDAPYLQGLLSLSLIKTCEWTAYDAGMNAVLQKVEAGRKAILNFPLLALTDSLELQRKASEIWVQDKHPFDDSLGPLVKRAQRDKIRIGYYSADFHNHATAYLMAEFFEMHDRSKFELFAFSFGPDKQDGMRQRLTQSFDQFIDVSFNSDKEIAEFSRMLGIDIAVDLKGSTKDHRFGIFSYRAAPVQISYLGYPGTMGADYIDYLIADKIVILEAHQKHYAEKIIYLPDSYQVNDRKRVIADKTYTRQELGLPSEGFVFCCFNNNYKITPSVFDSWVRILKAVPNSVLWLFQDNPLAAINLRKEAKARGIDEARLVFAKSMPLDHHLARHSAADLFLDTLPYNAHTTASDALWAGLPLLTCMGESFASRVAASLLKAVGMPELIANTQEEYEATAIELAQNPDQLSALKQKLQSNCLSAPLFDTEKITRHIEQAYADVYERYHADLMPENIYVEN